MFFVFLFREMEKWRNDDERDYRVSSLFIGRIISPVLHKGGGDQTRAHKLFYYYFFFSNFSFLKYYIRYMYKNISVYNIKNLICGK